MVYLTSLFKILLATVFCSIILPVVWAKAQLKIKVVKIVAVNNILRIAIFIKAVNLIVTIIAEKYIPLHDF